MSSASRRRGFTLIEALAAVLILTTGIVAAYTGLSALQRGEARARDQELLQRLADEKYAEVVATEPDLRAPSNGDFSDRNLPDIRFEVESEATGVENLQAITVRVESDRATDRSPVGEASGLVYVPPVTEQGAVQ